MFRKVKVKSFYNKPMRVLVHPCCLWGLLERILYCSVGTLPSISVFVFWEDQPLSQSVARLKMNRNGMVATDPTELLGNFSYTGDDVLPSILFFVSCSFLHFTGTCGKATCLCCLAFSLPSSLMGLFSAWWFRVRMRPRLCLVGGRKQVLFHVVWLPVHFYVQMSAFLDQGDQAIVLRNPMSKLLVVHSVDMCCECL